jgi:hypothetical protein
MDAHVRTIAGVGGKHHSQSLCICLTSSSSCLLVSNLRPSTRLATEPVLPRNRLLRVDRLTFYFLATAAMLQPSEELRNAIASSIDPMFFLVIARRRGFVDACESVHLAGMCTDQGGPLHIYSLYL